MNVGSSKWKDGFSFLRKDMLVAIKLVKSKLINDSYFANFTKK